MTEQCVATLVPEDRPMSIITRFLRAPDLPPVRYGARVPACAGSSTDVPLADGPVVCPACGQRVSVRPTVANEHVMRIVLHAAS